jgi:hypothetical protein
MSGAGAFWKHQEAQVVIEDWRKEYNDLRPLSTLSFTPLSVLSMHPNVPFARLSAPSGVAVWKK